MNTGCSQRAALWSLSLLMLALLAIRLALFALAYESHPSQLLAQDSAAYERLAHSILSEGRFGADRPEIVRTPGYPLFLASAYALFGVDEFWPLATQVALSVLTLLPLFWMGAMIWTPGTGFAAALLYSLDYISLLASQMLLTDTLYVFTLVTALSLGVAGLIRERGLWWLLLGFGILLSVATLIRPVSYYLIGPVLLGFALVYLRRWGWRRAAGCVLLIALPWLLIVGGWQARNYVVADTTELSAIKGINMMRYRGAFIIAQRDGISLLEAREVFQQEIPGLEAMSESERSAAYTRKAMQLVRSYPAHALMGQIKGTVQLLAVPGEADVLRFYGYDSPDSGVAGDLVSMPRAAFVQKWVVESPVYLAAFALALVYLLVLYVGAGFSALRLVREGGPQASAQILVAGAALYLIVVSGGPEGYPRLRMPITPLVALFAASGWAYLLGTRRRGR